MFSRVLLHLSLIDRIGPATALRFIEAFGRDEHSLEILYQLKVSELQSTGRLSAESAQRLYKGLADTKLLGRELELIEKYGIQITTLVDPTYPKQLFATHAPPIVLYSKGMASLCYNQQIALVGSRKADQYGASTVAAFVPELVHNNWYIVSGGAIGIDGCAHEETLKAGGTTIAILGSGLLKPYPKSHISLFKRIIDNGGALISPFPLMMEALPGLFPARNRIIAGLTRGCVVVQAALKSGALITAQYALHEGREVLAVPGAIDNPLSAGCHQLLAQGATLAASAFDILQVFGQELVKPKELTGLPSASTSAERIIHACREPISFAELLVHCGLEASVAQDLLFELSIEGKVMQNKVGLWCLSGC